MNTGVWEGSKVVHLAFVVRNIEETVDSYCKIFQMERPIIKQTNEPEIAQIMYNGKSTPARAKQAFIQLGNLKLEFMQPDENDSTWKECLEKNGECLHHIGVEVEDMDAIIKVLDQDGIGVVQSGKYRGGQYAYMDSNDKLKMMLELLANDK